MLSRKAKYALRALLLLAEQPSGRLVHISEISERQSVPQKFLEQILVELRRAGVLHSARGRNGGYALARPAGEITWGQIVRLIDGPLSPIPCASLTAYRRCDDCAEEETCDIRQTMRRVRDAMAEVLDGTPLSTTAPTVVLQSARAERNPEDVPVHASVRET